MIKVNRIGKQGFNEYENKLFSEYLEGFDVSTWISKLKLYSKKSKLIETQNFAADKLNQQFLYENGNRENI